MASYIDAGVAVILSVPILSMASMYISTESASGATAYGLYVDAGTGAGTEYAGIFMNGSVGIGDTTPDSPLEILSTTSPQFRLSYTDGSVDGTIEVDSNEYLILQAGTSAEIKRVQIGAGGAGSTTPDFFGLDVKSDTGDPAGGYFSRQRQLLLGRFDKSIGYWNCQSSCHAFPLWHKQRPPSLL
jgi:hypothetical protein